MKIANMLLRLRNMNIKRKISVSMLTIIVIFIVGFLLGGAILTGYIEYSDEGQVPSEISLPTWEKGQYWTYSFKTPDTEDLVSRIVVASDDGTDYQVGVSSRTDAQRHGVLNYNPMLGRVVMEDLGIYEKGIPQSLLSFPLKKGKEWTFTMFGINDLKAYISEIGTADLPDGGTTYIVDILATSPSGERLTYSYDSQAQWIHSLVLEDANGSPQVEMTLVSCGKGFSGDVFFVRGVDLIDQMYTAPVLQVDNTLIEGHPDWGPFESLIYHFEVSTGDGSGGTLILKDPTSSSEAMRRVFGPNIFENSLGTIPSPSEELSTQVTLMGNAYLRLRIAGGIEYVWTV
ncbi:MAG: hypothetical protein JSV56_11255 [Methanomassiliicoccales archaeon]|nr:MAG: hypothetical protein JSV56_11255 [Methanomassiliicoccales archaeon]